MIRILRRKNREPNKNKSLSSDDDKVEGRGGCFIKLPSEIIVEIMCRLPAVSVVRCKSVCKSWRSLIAHHPCFVYLNHRLIFSKPSLGCISICHLGDVLIHDKQFVGGKVAVFDKTSPISTAYIAASCNGLVCFLDYIKRDILFIWNPSTSICSRRSSPGFDIKYYGFGYDKSSDDYKFFAASSSKETTVTTTRNSKIYSLKTGKWKKTVDFPFCGLVYNADGKYSNGALHWATDYTSEEHSSSDHPWLISSLDLATKTYGQVSHPAYGHAAGSAYFCLTLGALGDQRLCVLCYYKEERRSDIWVMIVKDSWAKLVSIPGYIPDDRCGRYMFLPTIPLFIIKDEKMLFRYNKSRLILYDSKTGSCSYIQRDFEVHGIIYIFVENSMISPHHHGALITRASIQIKESIRAICKYYFGTK
uniref:F-box/kelch-repeat protein At3g23880-like n=1 Tax=Erigeron canadensis TaxID=72917 RepID=UPI001CB9AEC5|nr:F-box/kelch-repeat protein At3g23880-like [Erigeron canadensis]